MLRRNHIRALHFSEQDFIFAQYITTYIIKSHFYWIVLDSSFSRHVIFQFRAPTSSYTCIAIKCRYHIPAERV